MTLTRTLTIAAAVVLAACTPKESVQPDAEAAATATVAAPSATAGAADAGAVQTAPLASPAAASADPLGAIDMPGSPLNLRVFYFDFDRSEIRQEYLEALEAHARFLVQNPGVKLRLEGHCDERGTREYNIGLGDRRAQAMRRVLLFQGVNAAQLQTVSYGEERAAVDGHDEAAWSKNRRVELVYSK